MQFSPLNSLEDFMGRGGLLFSLSLIVSDDVINDVIMSDADCTPGREPRSVAASLNYNRRPRTHNLLETVSIA